MDIFIAVISILLAVVGVAGCVFPGLPGPPFNYVALTLLYFRFGSFSASFMWVWLGIVIIISILDYYIPIWTAKKYGATRSGIIGSIIGMLAGMIFTPIGMIAGTIIGAIAGDMMAGKTSKEAMRSGMATFFGTIASIGLKLVFAGVMFYYALKAVITYF